MNFKKIINQLNYFIDQLFHLLIYFKYYFKTLFLVFKIKRFISKNKSLEEIRIYFTEYFLSEFKYCSKINTIYLWLNTLYYDLKEHKVLTTSGLEAFRNIVNIQIECLNYS